MAIYEEKVAHLEGHLKTVFPNEQTIAENFGHRLILQRAIERENNN